MSKTLTRVERLEKMSKMAKNKALVDEYINQYQSDTKNAVESIIKMSLSVLKMNDKVKSGDFEEKDLDYFCAKVALNKNSSSFRKMICIGKYADKFQQYIDKLPSASSVLYEITTLDSDKFEELINNQTINPFVTLNEIKKASNKLPERTVEEAPNNNIFEIKIRIDVNQISVRSLNLITEFYEQIKDQKEITLVCSEEKLEKLVNFREKQFKIAA